MSDANTKATAAVAGAGAKEHTIQGADAHTVHAQDFDADSMRNKAVRFDDDVASSERFRVETGDRSAMWAHANYAQVMANQRVANAESEQRLTHQAKLNSLEISERQQDHAQRVRNADANITIQLALLGDMAEKLGKVYREVCQ